MNTRTAVQRMAAQAFPDDERLRRMVPEAERARRLHRILDETRLHSVPDPASRGRRWAPVLVVGVVVVAVLAAVAVFALPGPAGDPPLTGTADRGSPAPVMTRNTDLATTLPQLADRAEAQPAPVDEPYDYVHVRGIYPVGIKNEDGSVTPLPDEVRDRERWTTDTGLVRQVDTLTSRGGEEHDSREVFEPARLDLPTGPGALEDVLTSGKVWNPLRKPTLYFGMEEVWSSQVVDPPAQAALLRLLASKPDVHVVGPTTDRLGRPGLAVTVTETGEIRGDAVDKRRAVIEHTLIFDQRTGALLAFEAVQLEGGETAGPRPLSRGFEMVLKATRVASIEERP